MKEIFGVNVSTIMQVALIAFVMVVGATALIALKNRVLFKIGMRNIPRRKGQSILIVVGLMLSTLIISAAFSTGDSVARSGESGVYRDLGYIDETVSVETTRNGFGVREYFPQALFAQIEQGLTGDEQVDGLAPVVSDVAPLVNPTTRLSEQGARVLATEDRYRKGFGDLKTVDGTVVQLADLRAGEVYINQRAAAETETRQGEAVQVFADGKATSYQVRAILKDGGLATGHSSILMPLAEAQRIFGKPGQISAVLISNKGNERSGAPLTDAVSAKIAPLLAGSALSVQAVKQDGLAEAEKAGSSVGTMFNVFGLFSIMAGVMLIFLIFVMLAAERKSEMGMARAVGAQRSHLIQTLLCEGMIYDLAAAAVGAALGILVTMGMVGVMSRILEDAAEFSVVFDFRARSLLLSYCLGMVVTFLVVGISAWRVSKVNIVAAIRDLSEHKRARGGRRGLIVAVAMLGVGAAAFALGAAAAKGLVLIDMGFFFGMVGVGLLMRWGLSHTAMRQDSRDRIAYSFIGMTQLAWWLVPVDFVKVLGLQSTGGTEIAFAGSIALVASAVWLIMYNADLILWALQHAIGRLGHMAPVLATAVAYPMAHKFRTGLTLAMFTLVVFCLTIMSVDLRTMETPMLDTDRMAGGYDVVATVNYNNPVPDMRQALAAIPALKPGDITAIGSQTEVPMEVRQPGTDGDWKPYQLAVVDDGFLAENEFGLSSRATGYSSARAVWEAVRDVPGYAVIDGSIVPVRGGSFAPTPEFKVRGIYQDDRTFQPFDLEIRDPRSSSPMTVRVIGVVDWIAIKPGIHISQRTFVRSAPSPLPTTTYFFRTRDGLDNVAAAKTIEAALLEHGAQAQTTRAMVDQWMGATKGFFNLLQGFLGLGLIVGIAALGVIVMRAVVERRRQIGVLRAIGYQRGMVLTSFLVESSMITLLGIGAGTALGIGMGWRTLEYMAEASAGYDFSVPWLQVLVIMGIAYGFSLLMAVLPARQASRIVPAEALRYE